MSNLKFYIRSLKNFDDLPPTEAEQLFHLLITDDDENHIAELLRSWESKGVSETELNAIARLMRTRMKKVAKNGNTVADIVGTGGSPHKTFNVSTAASFVAAGAGVPVAKHGNRAATSTTGSGDVLTELGVEIGSSVELAEKCLQEAGMCFMFAPDHHELSPALARARRAVGRPTIFNNLGPLCNPANAEHQVIGVWNADWIDRTANVLASLGTTRSWVVHNEHGLDEIGLKGKTRVVEVLGDSVRSFDITAGMFGILPSSGDVPQAANVTQSAAIIRGVLGGKQAGSSAEQIVLINAAAAILIAGRGDDMPEAYAKAEESLRSGAAMQKLVQLTELTNR